MHNGNQTKTDYLFILIMSIVISSSFLLFTIAKEPNYQWITIKSTEQEIHRISMAEEILTWESDKLIEPRIKENKPTIKREETKRVQLLEDEVWEHVIWHKWYDRDDIIQKKVQLAYDLWWMRQVIVQECENWWRDEYRKWDSGKALWMCQMNQNYHNLPKEYYGNWEYQTKYCAEKIKWWTPFYWPDRPLYKNWKYIGKCKDVVKSRFVLTTKQ